MINNSKRVLVFGATGLVGKEVLRQLPSMAQVNVLTRRPLPKEIQTSQAREFVASFDQLDSSSDCFDVGTVICAIGTTIKKAGSQEAFRKVDYFYPLKIARLAKARGAKTFLLVSAAGANPDSVFFYNRVKGELERDLKQIGFANLVIVRPSVLVGHREEVRLAESAAQKLFTILPRKWRAVPARNVAQALVQSLEKMPVGVRVIENAELF